jgi:hypothetical protein
MRIPILIGSLLTLAFQSGGAPNLNPPSYVFEKPVGRQSNSLPPPHEKQEDQSAARHSKTYRNNNYNFCFDYPASAWKFQESLSGNGITLTPIREEKFRLVPSIGASCSVGQPSEKDESQLQTLDQDFQSRLEAMKTGPDAAADILVLSKQVATIQGLPAIISTDRFTKGSPGQTWFEKDILIHTQGDNFTYHLGLMCHPDDAAALLPVFDRVVKSFRILGPPA